MIIKYWPPTASGRREGWGKHVTTVDTTKSNGFAFEGEFLCKGENELPEGAVVVQKRHTGSVKNFSWEWELGSVQESGKIAWREETWGARSFLSFRNAVAEALAQEDCPRARAQRLRGRIAELRVELEAAEAELVLLRADLETAEAELAA